MNAIAKVLQASPRQCGANSERAAPIWADANRKRRGYGTTALLSHHKKLSNGDGVTGGTRCPFEAQGCETECEFVDFRRR